MPASLIFKGAMEEAQPFRVTLESTAPGSKDSGRWRPGPMDLFFGLNVLLLAAVISGGYWQRWLQVRGPGSAAVWEFGFYAVVLMAVTLGLWRWLRRHPLPTRLLVMMEAGAIAHFAGGLWKIDGLRLYGHVFHGIRFDKYVHAANSWIIALLVEEICRQRGWSAAGRLAMALAAFALGLAWEACEGIVVLAIPGNGVGSISDNLRDLAANAFGLLLFLGFARTRTPLLR